MPQVTECFSRTSKGKAHLTEHWSKENSDEGDDVEYDDDDCEGGVIGDGIETLVILKRLMTPRNQGRQLFAPQYVLHLMNDQGGGLQHDC